MLGILLLPTEDKYVYIDLINNYMLDYTIKEIYDFYIIYEDCLRYDRGFLPDNFKLGDVDDCPDRLGRLYNYEKYHNYGLLGVLAYLVNIKFTPDDFKKALIQLKTIKI